MRLDAAGTAEQDVNAFAAQVFEAAAEGCAGGEGGIDEREDDDRDAEGGGLGEDAKSVGVADALGSFVDRVVGGRRDDNGVGRAGPGLARSAVLAADRAAGLGLQRKHVQEAERRGRGDDLNRPALFLGEFDEPADFGGGLAPQAMTVSTRAGCVIR